MRDEVFVVGVGMTRFGKFPDRSLRMLGREAVVAALADADMEPSAIGMIACGTARSGIMQGRESGVGQMVGWEVGINRVPVYNVKNYCASGSTAFNVAVMGIRSGACDIALAVGLEKMSLRSGKGRPLTSDGMEIEGDLGFTPPAYFAMAARRHMEQYGTTREQMAKVAVKNRQAAALNPVAQYRDPVTIEDVLAARPVVAPLGLLDCCPTGDGAAAAVLVSGRVLERLSRSRAVKVAASVLGTGIYEPVKDLTTLDLDVAAAKQAYEQAGLGPDDVQVAEVHDAFTIAELIHYEDLGFCAKGDGGRLVDEGVTALGGRLPVSPSGGLLTKGHPLGATGIAQIVEVVTQIRGEAGARQAGRPRVGLTHVSGGFQEGDFATSTITILVDA